MQNGSATTHVGISVPHNKRTALKCVNGDIYCSATITTESGMYGKTVNSRQYKSNHLIQLFLVIFVQMCFCLRSEPNKTAKQT